MVLVNKAPVVCEVFVPLQLPGVTLQEVASFACQVIVDDEPDEIVLGEADMLTVGGGELTLTVALFESEPPGPVQLIV